MDITRSNAMPRQALDLVASLWGNTPGSALASNQNIPQQPSHERSVSSSTQDLGGHLTNSLAGGNERKSAVRIYHGNYLGCPDLSWSLEVK